MVYFQTKNPNLGKFGMVLDGKLLLYFMAIGNILRIFGIFYYHLVHFVFILYIFSGFGIVHQETSGNPVVAN
jgi:formate hydrogenlyase subunit 3/multisubunit Na+/H+ antiporter MnhD subunit